MYTTIVVVGTLITSQVCHISIPRPVCWLLWVSKIQWLRSRSTSGDTLKVCTPERIQIPVQGGNYIALGATFRRLKKLPGENAVYCSTLSCPRPQLHRPLHLWYHLSKA